MKLPSLLTGIPGDMEQVDRDNPLSWCLTPIPRYLPEKIYMSHPQACNRPVFLVKLKAVEYCWFYPTELACVPHFRPVLIHQTEVEFFVEHTIFSTSQPVGERRKCTLWRMKSAITFYTMNYVYLVTKWTFPHLLLLVSNNSTMKNRT